MDCGSSATEYGPFYSSFSSKPNSSASASNAANFWDEILNSRIDPIGTAPPLEQYSSATTSSAEALDEMERILRDAMDPILSRYYDEERALEFILQRLRERRGSQEHALDSSLSIINQHRNLLTPVARLPPEILSRIFVLNAQPVHRDLWLGAAKTEPEWWVDAARTSSQVCRRWRQVALDCPEIWSHISFNHKSQRWIAEMIERSHSAPLSLLGGHKIKWNEALMNLAANNMHRFKSIDLCRAGHNTKYLFKIFSKSTPMLEHLTLASDYYAERAVVIPAFPQEFLGGCAPNLRHVKLSTSAHTPWDSGLFTNLTSLEVSGGRGYDASLSSLEMLLVALTRMPGLELLILRESIPPCAGPTTRRIHANLPSLERMELRDSLDSCTNLLRQVIINTNTTLLLNFSYNITREEVDGFGKVFPPRPWATSTPAKTLEWKTHDFNISAWSAPRGSKNTRTPLAMVWARFITLVSPQLRSSRISNIIGWDVDCWRGFAHAAPELQSLSVGCAVQVVALCEALRPPNRPNLVPEDCCFPALSHLELAAHYTHAMSTPGGGEAQLSTVLARILAERAQIGCSTPELVFNFRPWSEKFPDGWSEPFREAVPGITVREHRGPTMSPPDLLFLLRSN